MGVKTVGLAAIGCAACAFAACSSSSTDTTPPAPSVDSSVGDEPPTDDDAGIDEGGAVDAPPPKDSGGKPQPDTGPPPCVPDASAPDNTYAKFRPIPPQVLPVGGPVMQKPKIQAITFDGDPYRAQLETFVANIGASSWWGATANEYCIAPATALPPVHLSETPPASLDQLEMKTWIDAKVNATTFALPDDQTLYVVFFPSGTTLTLQNETSCTQFGGYHDDTTFASTHYSYAAIPRCGSFSTLTGLDALTYATSHEILEAVTDPRPYTDQAWAGIDPQHFVWATTFGNELGDMCVWTGAPLTVHPSDLGFTVQRVWSNTWAKAGRHPCTPGNLATPYFAAAPVAAQTVSFTYQGQSFTSQGVVVPVGQTVNVDVQLFSDAPTADWALAAGDFGHYAQGRALELDVSLDRTTGNNGDVAHLTVHAVAAAPATIGFSTVMVTSTIGNETTNWPLLIVNQ